MKRFILPTTLAVAALLAADARAQTTLGELRSVATTRTPDTDQPFTYTRSGGMTTLSFDPTATGSFEITGGNLFSTADDGDVFNVRIASMSFTSTDTEAPFTPPFDDITGFSGELVLETVSGPAGTLRVTVNNGAGLFIYTGGTAFFTAMDNGMDSNVEIEGMGALETVPGIFDEQFAFTFGALSVPEYNAGSGRMSGAAVFDAAIPEPSTVVLAGLGLLVLPAAAAARRRRPARA